MIGKFLCMADVPDEYTSKRGTVVKTQVLTLMDIEAQSDRRLIQPLDYSMSPDEKAAFAGKLADKRVTLAVREFSVFGGRFRVRGKILEIDGKPVDVPANGTPK